MKLSDFLRDVGSPVAYYPSLAKCLGGVKQTVFLCQLFYWHGKQHDEEGWIYKEAQEMEAETGLSREEQRTARKHLIKIGVLEEKYARLNHRMNFRVNPNTLNELWERHLEGVSENGNAPMGNSLNGDSGKAPFPNAGKSNSGNGESHIRIKEQKTTPKTTDKEHLREGAAARAMSNGKHSTGRAAASPSEVENINHIYEVWKSVMEHPNAKLVKKREKAILYRLREGYTVRDIELAIEGCKESDYHMGVNDNGKQYDDIELICRDGVKLEGFIEMRITSSTSQWTCTPCKTKISLRDMDCPNCGTGFHWKCIMTGKSERRLVAA